MSAGYDAPRRRRPLRAALVGLLLVLPLLELFVLVQVGQAIGGWPVFGLLVLAAACGGWLVRREGRRAWTTLSTALQSGRMPARELTDSGLVLLGGVLLVLPGFISDVVGILLALPLTRPVARNALAGILARRIVVASGAHRPAGRPSGGPLGDNVVRGEVVDDDPPPAHR